jgi:hypothetical protein
MNRLIQPEDNSWDALSALLENELDGVLQPLLPVLIGMEQRLAWHTEMAAAEPAHRKALNAALLHYAQHEQWPFMTPQQAALAFVRVGSAVHFLSILRCQVLSVSGLRFPELPHTTSRKQALAFLLVDWWELSAREQWLGYIHGGCV